jgi:hypothetical protein
MHRFVAVREPFSVQRGSLMEASHQLTINNISCGEVFMQRTDAIDRIGLAIATILWLGMR